MGFEKIYVTNKGMELEAKARTGKELKLLRIDIGSGSMENANINEQSAIINKIMECSINSLQEIEGQTIINFILEQSKVNNGFYFREFGIIAKDPDSQEEILYMYANAGNKAEYINDKTAQTISDKIIDIIVKEDNADNVTISIDNTSVYIERQEYQNKITELENTKADLIRYKTITLETDGWTQNTETENYEYDIQDSTITANHLVEAHMDLANQAKMTDGYIESYNGGYKIITSAQPEEDVVMNISIQKATVEPATNDTDEDTNNTDETVEDEGGETE